MDRLGPRFWSKADQSGGLDSCWEWSAQRRGGYGRYWLDGRTQNAHCLVCEIVLGECPDGQECRHLCGNRACCNPLHLAWGTGEENAADRWRHGTVLCGVRNPRTKLSEEQVEEIRRTPKAWGSQSELARHFGVNAGTISRIVSGKARGSKHE